MKENTGTASRILFKAAMALALLPAWMATALAAETGRWLDDEGGTLNFTPSPNYIVLHDQFFHGQRIDTPIFDTARAGELGWKTVHALAAPVDGAPPDGLAQHPGVLRVLFIPPGNSPYQEMGQLIGSRYFIKPQQVKTFHAILRAPYSVAGDHIIKFGLFNHLGTSTGSTTSVQFHYRGGTTPSNGSPNWIAITGNGVGSTRTDTGVPVLADKWYLLRASRLAGGEWQFYINDSLVATHTTHVDYESLADVDSMVTPGFGIFNATSPAVRLDIDEFTLVSSHLGQRWD